MLAWHARGPGLDFQHGRMGCLSVCGGGMRGGPPEMHLVVESNLKRDTIIFMHKMYINLFGAHRAPSKFNPSLL